MEHPIHQLIQISLENIKQMVDVDKIVGNPIQMGSNLLVVPICKVGSGFAAGGTEFQTHNANASNSNLPFGGGSGAGVSITPIAFLVVQDNDVRLMHLEKDTHLFEKIIDFVQSATKPKEAQSKQNTFIPSPKPMSQSTTPFKKDDLKDIDLTNL